MTLAAPLALAVDDAIELLPSARTIAVIGPDELAQAVSHRYSHAAVRLFNDIVPLSDEAPAARVVRCALNRELFAGVDLVVGALPKTLAELDDIARFAAAASHGQPEPLIMTLAGREKYLARSMNDVLAASFERVWASRGRHKSRALRASSPRAVAAAEPRRAHVPELGFDVFAVGGAFAGATLDIGTRVLVDEWNRIVDALDGPLLHVVDLGCGTGVLGTLAARRLPSVRVTATDRSWSAVASTTLTTTHAAVADRVTVTHDDAGALIDDGSVDLVLFNPPFHDGTAVDADMSHRMFRSAARMLRPGGALVVVFNSHLPHRPALERLVGATEQLARTPKFTLTLSRRHERQ